MSVTAMAAVEGGEASTDSPGQATANSNDCEAFDQLRTRQAHAEVGAVSADAAGIVSLATSFDRVGSDLESVGARATAEITGTPITFVGDFRQKSGRGEAGTTFVAGFTVTDAPAPYVVTQVVSVVLADTLEGADVSFANVRLVDSGSATTIFERQVQPAANVDVTTGSPTGTLEPGSYRFECTLTLIGRGTASVDADVSFSPGSEIRWRLPASGSFGVAANWDPARVPGAEDRARFELVGTYDVQLGGIRTLRRALVRTNAVGMVGGTLALTGFPGESSLSIGDGASLGLSDAKLEPTDVVIGDVPLGAPSALRLLTGGVLAATAALRVGASAPGVLEVVGGTASAGSTSVGGPPDSGGPAVSGASRSGAALPVVAAAASASPGGTIRVNGGGGTFANLSVGSNGAGLVDVLGGGVLNVPGDSVVGVAPGPGLAVVNGISGSDAFSTWQADLLVVGGNAEGTFDILAGGRAEAANVVLGRDVSGDGTLTVAGSTGSNRSRLRADGRLHVGFSGRGTLQITDGEVQAGEVRVASIDDLSEGTIQMNGGLLSVAGLLGVGLPGAGELNVTGFGASVFANTLAVASFSPADAASQPSFVDVALGTVSIKDAVLIGGIVDETGALGAFGSVIVKNGGSLRVTSPTGRVEVKNGELIIEGRDGFVPSRLEAPEVQIGNAEVRVRDGGRTEAGKVFVGVLEGPLPATPELLVDGASLVVTDALEIGVLEDAGFPGRLRLAGDPTVQVANQLVVGPGGSITGNGLIRVGAIDIEPAGGTLTNLGVISAGTSPGTIGVDGNYTQGPTGKLVAEVAGTAPGAFDVLDVTGKTTLGGTLEIRFVNGFAPKAGDVLPILPLGRKPKGAFASVQVTGLAPGFDFTLGTVNGALGVTALTDGVAAVCAGGADADLDGVVDCADVCPFAANAPSTMGAPQADADGDGIGDACDPCAGGVPIEKPMLTVKKGLLAFKGKFVRPGATALAPAATGVRLLLEDGAGAVVLDATAPAGVFDRATKRGWKKLGFKGGAADAVAAVGLKQAAKKPEPIGFKVVAPVAGVDFAQIVPPLRATLVIDAPVAETGLCGEMRFTGPPGVSPLCRTDSKGKTVCTAVKRKSS